MKVALYARVSSDKQDIDLSISAQIKALREFANKNGHIVIKEYVDEVETGRSSDRPSFQQMIATARKKPLLFEAILVWKLSRFARSREDSIVYKTLLRKHNVNVISINEPFEDTPTGRLLEGIIESLDEFYSANLGQEVMRGLRESASRGFYIGGHTPFGYKRVKVKDGIKDRSKLAVEEKQSAIVERLFREAASGKSLKDILKELNEEGIAGPQGKRWAKTTLYHILTNEVYTGTLVWGRHRRDGKKPEPVRVEDAWPAIIDKKTFDRVQALIKLRAPEYIHPRRASSHFLLSGIAFCGSCGKALVGQDAKSGQFSYYVCGTLLKQGAGACDMPYLNARNFEKLVIQKIKERILTEENLRDLVHVVHDEMDATADEHRKRIDIVESELNDVQCRLERLYDSLETGKLALEDVAPRIQKLRCQQDQLEATKEEWRELSADHCTKLFNAELVVKYVEDLRCVLADSSLSERKTFIRSFVKDIHVANGEALLKYTIPLPPQGILEEKAGVLSTVQNGSGSWIRTNDLRVMSPTSYHCSIPRRY